MDFRKGYLIWLSELVRQYGVGRVLVARVYQRACGSGVNVGLDECCERRDIESPSRQHYQTLSLFTSDTTTFLCVTAGASQAHACQLFCGIHTHTHTHT